MRRPSFFAGLVLLLLGGLLLWNNLHPEMRLWTLFERYWPVLLIVWGFAKLLDHFAARSAAAAGAPVQRTFSGGEVFLLIVLLMFGLTLSGIKEAGRHIDIGDEFPWGQTFTFNSELSKPVTKPEAQIAVRITRGNVVVVPSDAQEIKVSVEKKVRTTSDETEARARADEISIEIRETQTGYEIAEKESRDRDHGPRVATNLTITLPKKANLDVSTSRGDVQARGMLGKVVVDARGDVEVADAAQDVTLQKRGGDSTLMRVKGNVKITGRGGDIRVENVDGEATIEGEYTGNTHLAKISRGARFLSKRTDLTVGPLEGSLELDSGDLQITGVKGSVSLITSNKDVRFDGIAGRVQVQNRRGNVDVRFPAAPKDEVDIANESGDVTISLPPTAAFEIVASSNKGEVSSQFSELKPAEDKDSARVEGKIGAKGPRIQIRTTYGTVHINKTSGELKSDAGRSDER